MKDETKDINWLLSFPRTKKWVVQCSTCGTFGYRHDAPEKFYNRYYLEKHFQPMKLDDLGACEECSSICSDQTNLDKP